MSIDETKGFVKVVTDTTFGRVLGMYIPVTY
jgi:pyruvate/2-oxoglutarate dehydrogenase complex dihydrolipoamide dehydrogenase (E3) component